MVRGSLITLKFQIAALFIGFGSLVILARMLGDHGLGLFTIFKFIPTCLHAVSNIGLNLAIVNFIGRKKYATPELAGLAMGGGLLISVITLVGFRGTSHIGGHTRGTDIRSLYALVLQRVVFPGYEPDEGI